MNFGTGSFFKSVILQIPNFRSLHTPISFYHNFDFIFINAYTVSIIKQLQFHLYIPSYCYRTVLYTKSTLSCQLRGKKLFTFFIHLSPLQYQLRLAIEQTRNINMVKTFKILNKKAKYKSKSTLSSNKIKCKKFLD